METATAPVVALPRLPAAIPRSGISESARLALRQWLGDTDRALADAFRDGASVDELVPARAQAIEKLLRHVWTAIVGEPATLALFAVGGFGRGELFPRSDTDLLVLTDAVPQGSQARSLETLFTCLWDLGLKPGHAVRTLAQCRELAASDASVYTSLLEGRRIAGAAVFDQGWDAMLGDPAVWPPAKYLAAKREEQAVRHARYHDTAYNLEPNLKDGPGGLRSLHVIGWLGRRLFGIGDLRGLARKGLLSKSEWLALGEARATLWRARYALHLLAGRPEERLLFDFQRELASRLGYRDEHAQNLGVEQFMQSYYRAAMVFERTNAAFLQRCDEALAEPVLLQAEPIGDGFVAMGDRVDIREPDLFERRPAALIDVFIVLVDNPELSGLRAHAQCRLQAALELHGESLREDAAVHAAFLRLLRRGAPAVEALARMSRHGLLAQYLPAFGKVVGRMQYDLFHVYTVDEHTLRVLRIVARFAQPQHSREFALASDLFSRLAKPELLLLAALFHDIAKGRGGDHSELGEVEARDFCARLGLSPGDIDIVAWLVRWHLLMSVTAQRQDITDPDVVHRFAAQVGEWDRLDLLYLLTCADIAGTSPKLWNSWKDRLLADLYVAARYVLRGDLERPPHADEQRRDCQAQALEILAAEGIDQQPVTEVWNDFPEEAFLRYRPEQIAWQTRAIVMAAAEDLPLVLVQADGLRGGSEIFIYADDRDGLFATVTAALDRLHLSVQEARILSSRSGMSIDTFLVLDASGEAIDRGERSELVAETLRRALRQNPYRPQLAKRSMARPLRHFHIPARIEFRSEANAERTQVSLVCSDRPGLLAVVAQVFRERRVRVHDARIATFGERAEDFFQITDQNNRPLSRDSEQALQQALLARLNAPPAPTVTKEIHARS
ncbi:[protein-PII] uridylyltransferase [Tahibacter amnicola]|uniref:Bifunctional uridylyltransferase/uridylyl-removing enzyme n=1 Tax=Tahibacter amnicola TaxID=2976241 RepID=A0ABY6BDU1_9GAMM|nr:[protein-PII] uridylyltransferase [Tahibacter amnicola]UXI66791.1 [protein-PII] uridylyltransferase [Tahibacter amnicola]